MGWNAQPTAQVVLDGVRVPADAMLGGVDGEGGGFGIAMNGLNGGRINIAACSLGGAQAAYDQGATYGAPAGGPWSTTPIVDSPWPTRPPRWRRRDCCCGGRPQRWTATPTTRSRSAP